MLQLRTLAALLPDEPPSEFRIFKAGVNTTQKGSFTFDSEAAAAVLAAYQRNGVDLMIDLEHHSLGANEASRVDAADARGWFQLAMRNGELWAVNVRWTPDGERRLREKTQRYTSPAFWDADGRVTELVNVAICARPATHDADALIAASASHGLARDRAAVYLARARHRARFKR